jgi:hypothetical protein
MIVIPTVITGGAIAGLYLYYEEKNKKQNEEEKS